MLMDAFSSFCLEVQSDFLASTWLHITVHCLLWRQFIALFIYFCNFYWINNPIVKQQKNQNKIPCLPPFFPLPSLTPAFCTRMHCGKGREIQEVTPVVSMATLRSAPWGRRPLLKHKAPRGLDQHKQPSFSTLIQTHTHSQMLSTYWGTSCVISVQQLSDVSLLYTPWNYCKSAVRIHH